MTTPNGIPNNAKRVFQGTLYDVWHWNQEMFDGTTQVFERLVGPETATVFAVVEDKILIQQQEQPHRSLFLSLPGGRCDEGENPLETAKRELLEETGYTSEQVTLWKTLPSGSSSILRDSHYFIARGCAKQGEPNLDNGERISNQLVSFDELIEQVTNEKFRDQRLRLVFFQMLREKTQLEEFQQQLFDLQ